MKLDQITSFLHGQSDTKITFCKICKDNFKKWNTRLGAKLMTALQDNWLGLSCKSNPLGNDTDADEAWRDIEKWKHITMLKKYQYLPKWKSFQKFYQIDKQFNQNNKNNNKNEISRWQFSVAILVIKENPINE